jgi:D-alanyl-D-alanine carboxypeptidase
VGGFLYFTRALQTTYTSYADQKPPEVNIGHILESTFGQILPDQNAFSLTAKSALVYDIDSKEILYSKNPTEKLPMASLTKIMTAIVGMEYKRDDDTYVVDKSALVGEDSMGLLPDEKLSLNELLYGLLLPSGNDAAEVIAQNFPYGRESFIEIMNRRAKQIGAQNTHFSNPSGLQGDGVQYTTSEDLVKITYYALTNFPQFAEVVQTYQYSLPQTRTHQAYALTNETNLLTSYPGVKGVKTGFTPEAGLCLVTYLEYGNKKLLGVILGSENRRAEMKMLLDYGLKQDGITPPKHD